MVRATAWAPFCFAQKACWRASSGQRLTPGLGSHCCPSWLLTAVLKLASNLAPPPHALLWVPYPLSVLGLALEHWLSWASSLLTQVNMDGPVLVLCLWGMLVPVSSMATAEELPVFLVLCPDLLDAHHVLPPPLP